MRQSSLTLAFFSFSLLLFSSVSQAADPFMRVEEVHRGMRGVGRTVFHGETIDTFSVEILGVARNGLGPGQDLILARLSGGPLEQAGLIRGMSGSPVYVKGRLIGAVAYGWSFAKIPICGITPIRQMLQVLDRDLAPAGKAGASIELGGEAAALLRGIAPEASGSFSLVPLGTPVWVTGSTSEASRLLEEVLAPFGLHVLAGAGGGGSSPEGKGAVEPGSPLGVQLVCGDMSVTGIGTLTYVDGEKVIGFGHPMLLIGSTDMPMTSAYIHDIVPSRFSSFKIGAASAPIGAIRQDRAPAVAGVLGPAPSMLPVNVEVFSKEEGSFHFGLVRHRDLIPGLARVVLLSSLEAAEKLFGEATVEFRSVLYLSGSRRIEQEQIYSGDSAVLKASLDAIRPLEILAHSPFPGADIDSLYVRFSLRERIQTARILGVRVGASPIEAGKPLDLWIRLGPYHQEPVVKKVRISLPKDLASGPLLLRVGSGSASLTWEQRRKPDAFQPRSLRQLLEMFSRRGRNDELIVELYRKEPGITIGGRELPGLPPLVRAMLDQENSAGYIGPVFGRVILRRCERMPYVLSGERTLELTVRETRR